MGWMHRFRTPLLGVGFGGVGVTTLPSLCGLDEAGRGALAGPLTLAGVILPETFSSAHLLRDSKQLSAVKREQLCAVILKQCAVRVFFLHSRHVDSIGLSRSLGRALEEIKSHLEADSYLFDGPCAYGVQGIDCLVRADTLIPSVQAASIVAKVLRDRHMKQQSVLYPGYGLESHKGYGTAAHKEAISRLGPSPLHRRSFKFRSNY